MLDLNRVGGLVGDCLTDSAQNAGTLPNAQEHAERFGLR
jgi:hypothetical protein